MSMPRLPSTDVAATLTRLFGGTAAFGSRSLRNVAVLVIGRSSLRISGLRSTIFRSVTGDIRLDHLPRIDNPVEIRRTDSAELQCGLLERQVVIEREMGNLRSLVVTNHRAKCGDEHQ